MNKLLLPPSKLRRFGFAQGITLIELLVVMTIIAVLAALIIPASTSVWENAKTTKCMHNLRQLSGGWNLYVADHNGEVPIYDGLGPDGMSGSWWHRRTAPYLETQFGTTNVSKIYLCPAETDRTGTKSVINYAANDLLQGCRVAGILNNPIIITDGDPVAIPNGHSQHVTCRHRGNANMVFKDGSVRPMASPIPNATTLPTLWKPQ